MVPRYTIYPYNPMVSGSAYPLIIGPLYQPVMSVPSKRTDYLLP